MSPAKTEKDAADASAGEREAVRAWRREVKAARGGKPDPAQGENDVLEAIAAMPAEDRGLAEQIHRLVKATAPGLVPRTWYGMPAYAKDGKVICFFQNAGKFKARYSTLGFSDKATLDDGDMWPTSFALTKLTPTEEKRIAALVSKAVG